MKSIKVLGTGCPKCNQTMNIVQEAISQSGTDAQVEKVDDIMKILEYDVMTTPAVVVDGEVRVRGRVPKVDEILDFLK